MLLLWMLFCTLARRSPDAIDHASWDGQALTQTC
jgi:hypothetical protein